jgi:hypothetical protein
MDAHATLAKILRSALLCAAAATTSGCWVRAYPARYGVYEEYPPADYVVTTEPVYFEGRPAYWYHDRWYYRNGPRWEYYRSEPRNLEIHREEHGPPARYNYGRPSINRHDEGRHDEGSRGRAGRH